MVGRKDYPELTEAVLEQWRTSALEDLEAGRTWQCHPLAVLAVVEALDQGCELCDHMVTDRMDLPEDPEFDKGYAHFWVCGDCWNAEVERRQSAGHVPRDPR